MELVYLWVEEYKNIYKQGFNFSPRFECEYDEEIKELTINKNDDYIENFFDKKGKINITAIVGENGSGKSGIIESIIKILKDDFNDKFILIKNDKTYLTNIDDLNVYGDTSFTISENYKINTCYFKHNIENEWEQNNNHIHYLMLNTQSIGNAIAKNYDEGDTNFKLSSFMMIPIMVEIKLKEGFKEKDLNNNSLKCNTPMNIKEFIENKDIFFTKNKYVIFDFIDKEGRKYSDLSHGEQTIYGQLLQIYFYIKESKPFLFLFDEPETALHPQWQKGYLNEVITLFQSMEKQAHFMFTSHSPFLISDLPKENVIFLDTYKKDEDKNQKEGNCKNVTDTTDINPFGANIHTLLSDGFFMKGGLMGEFAKGKIQNVINFINNKKSNLKKEEIFPIIELIGEPFLQHKLKEQYFEKYPKERNIDDEISTLKQKLKELENVKNSK